MTIHPVTPPARTRRPLRGLLAAALLLGAAFAPAHAAVPAAERDWLAALYNGTQGASWTNNANWLTGDPCDDNWYGITCATVSGVTHVTGISVFSNNLAGTLPAGLNGLTNLAAFYAGSNQLTGPIPSLSGLTGLTDFYVQDNQLTGPIPDLTGLTSLQGFDTSFNQLTGPVPDLTGLTGLQVFYVAANQLTGAIPSLPGLTSLRFLGVEDNQLTGSIPDLSGLTGLEQFYVQNNQLTGPIPSLSGLGSLAEFYADNNQLTGPVPALPASLTRLQVHNNQLSGTIPAAPPALTPGGSAICMAGDGNAITGATPAWEAATGTGGGTSINNCRSIAGAPVITPVVLPAGEVGAAYSAPLGTTAPAGASWAVSSAAPNTLPAGLTLNADGTITGMPAAGTAGVYTFNVTASEGGNASAAVTYTLTVNPAGVIPIGAGGAAAVPTLGQWTLALLALALAGLTVSRRRAA